MQRLEPIFESIFIEDSYSNLYKRIHKFNILPTTVENAREFFYTLNSFYGFLGHYDSIKKKDKEILE